MALEGLLLIFCDNQRSGCAVAPLTDTEGDDNTIYEYEEEIEDTPSSETDTNGEDHKKRLELFMEFVRKD